MSSKTIVLILLILSIVFSYNAIATQKSSYIIISLILQMLVLFIERKYFMFSFIIFIIFLCMFWLKFMLAQPTFIEQTNIDEQGTIVLVKPSYYIIKIKNQRMLLRNDSFNFILGEKISLTGKVQRLANTANYYEFDFVEYLSTKFVYSELKLNSFESIDYVSFQFRFQRWINQLQFSELTMILWLHNRDNEFYLNNLFQQTNLTFLLSTQQFILVYLMRLIYQAKRKYSGCSILEISLIFIVTFYIYINGNNLLISRILIGWIINLIFSSFFAQKTNQIDRHMLIILAMLLIYPSYAFSTGFWYLSLAYITLAFLKNQSLTKHQKRAVYFLTFYFLFAGLQAYFNYYVNFTNPLYALILVPIINLYALITLLFHFVHSGQDHFLYLSLSTMLIVIYNYTIQINTGHIDLFVFVIFYLVLISIIHYHLLDYKIYFIGGGIIILSFALAWVIKPSNLLTMLNVGNANSFVYHNKWNNVTIVFDAGVGAGRSNELVTSYLKYIGVNKIDLIIISHFHEDHYNNLFSIKQNFKIDQIAYRNNFQDLYIFKNAYIRIFQNSFANSENDLSLIVLLDIGNFRALFMGDAESATENHLMTRIDFIFYLQLKQVNLLQVGHHGSKTSSSLAFLKFINPQVAFISGEKAGGNKNFPHPQTLQNLFDAQIKFHVSNGTKNISISIITLKITKK